MLRLAIGICVLAALIWLGGVHKLGDKTLAQHLDEIYRSPLVQKKLDALHKGFDDTLDDFALERSQKDSTKRRVQARVQERHAPAARHTPITTPHTSPPPQPSPSPMHSTTPIDVRPSAGREKTQPAQDSLTDGDRQELDKLVADKLR